MNDIEFKIDGGVSLVRFERGGLIVAARAANRAAVTG